MKKTLFLIVILSITMIVSSAAERNLFVDSEDSFDGLAFEYSNGVLTNGSMGTGSVYISIPGLTKNYTFKGHIKIVEVNTQPWNGIRVIVGADSANSASKLVVTRDWGTRVEFKVNNMNDLWADSLRLSEGTEFDFEVVRSGQHYVFNINGSLVLEGDIPEELDAFEDGYDFNLGFEASECHYEVSGLEIYCPDAPEITPTPEPTNTPEPTETPTNAPTSAPTPTPTQNNTADKGGDDSKISPVVIGVCVVAVLAVAGVIIVVIKDKKKK